MFGVLGMCALAIDVGSWYQQKQALQAAADAAALAGASQLPAGWSAAQTAGQQSYSRNGKGSDTVTLTQTSNLTANDSVTVTARRSAVGYFVRILGISSVNVTVSARATVESYTTFASTGDVMPFGVMQGDYTLGSSYTIYGDGSSSNNGALSLDIQSGSGCASANGASDLRNTVIGSSIACPISDRPEVDTKPGHIPPRSPKGSTAACPVGGRRSTRSCDRTGTVSTPCSILTSPQLVLIPIVLNTNGSTTWPNGSSQVRIVGFAWFVITGCGNPTKPGPCSNSDGKWVNGTFVSLINANTAGTTGAWNPNTNSASTIELTA